MRFAYSESFNATIIFLSRTQGVNLRKAIAKFERAWENRQFPSGLGLTHLRENFYEFRVDIHNRVLLQRKGDIILYILYGSHDAIRRCLKNL